MLAQPEQEGCFGAWAQTYLKLGYRLAPFDPTSCAGPKDWRRRGADLATVQGWARTAPTDERNAGLLTGHDGLVALDCDTDDPLIAQAIREILGPLVSGKFGTKGLTEFLTDAVGMYGKKTCLYVTDGEIDKNGKLIETKAIELLTNGQMTLIPPSRHLRQADAQYEWRGTPLHKLDRRALPRLPAGFFKKLVKALRALGDLRAFRVTGAEHFSDGWPEIEQQSVKERKPSAGPVPQTVPERMRPRVEAWVAQVVRNTAAELSQTGAGERNNQLNKLAHKLGGHDWMVPGGIYDEARDTLFAACKANGHDGNFAATFESGWQTGVARPLPLPDTLGELDAPQIEPKQRVQRETDISWDMFREMPDGLPKDVAQYILDTSVDPNPTLAVPAAISFVGALMGRRYVVKTGDDRVAAPNLYQVTLAPSGTGKSEPFSRLGRIEAALKSSMTISGVASGAALLKRLMTTPNLFMLTDEIGFFFQGVQDRNNPHSTSTRGVLLEIFSKSVDVYGGKVYANTQESVKPIWWPTLTLHGSGTPETFVKGMNHSNITDGMANRLLIFKTLEIPEFKVAPRPKKGAKKKTTRVPQPLIHRIKSLLSMGREGNVAELSVIDESHEPDVIEIEMTDAAWDLHQTGILAWQHAMTTNPDLVERGLQAAYKRAAEMAWKVEAILCASGGPPDQMEIDTEHVRWAERYVKLGIENMVHEVIPFAGQTEFEERCNRVLHWVAKAKTEGISNARLRDRLKMPKQKFDEAMEHLQTTERVIEVKRSTGGRPQLRWVAVEHD